MKLLYLIPGIGGQGGAERSLAAMVPFWTDRMDVHVVTFSNWDHLADDLISAGATVTNLSSQGRLDLARELASLVRSSRPDLIHTTLFDADIIGRLAAVRTRTPVSSSLVNVNYGPEQLTIPGRRRRALLAAQMADATTAQAVRRFHSLTHHVADVMSRRLLIRRSKIDVIPRGRDASLLGLRTPETRSEVRAALGIGAEPLVLAAARHEWQKGLDVLLQAAPRVLRSHPTATFLIGGRHGAQTEHLHALVAELGISGHVQFIGPREDVPQLMCAADVLCVPSRWEGLGSILIEAMAIGVPTVASGVGPVREVAGPDPWIHLAAPNDPVDLAAKILATIENPQAAHVASSRGLDLFTQGYQVDIVANHMCQFFENAALRRNQVP